MSYDIVYKTGDSDIIGAIIKENGIGVNLTGRIVTFVMKNPDGLRVVVPCTLGGTVNKVYVPGTSGGVSINFTEESTAVADEYEGEFVISWGDTDSVRAPGGNIPSDELRLSILIMEAL